jgi:hypothetical protein
LIWLAVPVIDSLNLCACEATQETLTLVKYYTAIGRLPF